MVDDYAYTVGMDQDEVATRLRDAETATLALARENDAYAIPVAIHFDGEDVFFRLGRHENSQKLSFVETTDTATLLLYDHDQPESWSIVVEGHLEELDADQRAALGDPDDLFLPLRVFGETVQDLDPVFVRLDVTSMTGRRTPEQSS